MQPIHDGDGEADACEEIAGRLVVAGGDCTPVLELAKGTLDEISTAIGEGIERRRPNRRGIGEITASVPCEARNARRSLAS